MFVVFKLKISMEWIIMMRSRINFWPDFYPIDVGNENRFHQNEIIVLIYQKNAQIEPMWHWERERETKCIHSPIHGAYSTVAFECIDLGDIIIAQLKVKDIEIAGDTIFADRFRDDNVATLNLIANQNLSRCFLVFFCNRKDLQSKLVVNGLMDFFSKLLLF